MKTLERLIPIIILLLVASGAFKLGMDYQKEKYIPCNDVYLELKPICNYCQVIDYKDTTSVINKKGDVVGWFILK